MAYIVNNGKIVTSVGKCLTKYVPSENVAIMKLQNFWTGINAYIVDYDALPTDQSDLESYMNFDSQGAYNFSYTAIDDEFGYFNAQSANDLIHSFTRTVAYDSYGFNDITCKKIGTSPPGPADYVDGVLSCQVGTDEV